MNTEERAIARKGREITDMECRYARAVNAKVRRDGGIKEHVCKGCGRCVTTHPSEICDLCVSPYHVLPKGF